ncbi:MAG: aminotransferase class III-fold pyridoxal phosphate-dependent enzyme, partial [candidate division Zixibacteria bacterium]|nr:aminotransferase class III-fold pyridoxal phosphate-dependent enzyme [candidate division Zixibacteria bacterium]
MTDTNTVNRSSIGFSQIPDQQVFEYDRTFGANHYGRLEVVVRQAEGAWLTDINGNKYLDCLAAYSAANPGHCHPRIAQALIDALQGGFASVISNVVYTDTRTLFLKRLAELVPQLGTRFGDNGNKGLCKNGGVESVETAIKMARYYGWKVKGIPDGQQELIVFHNNFHGRMISVVSFSSSDKYKQGFGPLTPGFVSVEYGSIDEVEKAITKNTCGILVEPMQGEGGMYLPPEGFLKNLRALSDKNDLFLIFDEIQVGLGRTGKMFSFEHEGVAPDGVILGKALSGGLVPLSAFVTNSKMMDLAFQPGSDGSTFGGYPLACVAGNAALDVITSEDLTGRSEHMGAILKKKIDDIA